MVYIEVMILVPDDHVSILLHQRFSSLFYISGKRYQGSGNVVSPLRTGSIRA